MVVCLWVGLMNNDSFSELGQQLRRLRKQKSWSQQQLADFSGLDRTTIGALERSDYSDIGIRKIQRVLDLFGKRLILADAGLPMLEQLQATAKQQGSD